MGHELREHDEQHGREMAWHGLTKVNPELAIDSPDFYLSKWDVEPVKVQVRRKGQFISLPGEGWETLLVDVPKRNEEGEEIEGETQPIFVAPPYSVSSYHALSNKDFLKIILESLKALGIGTAVQSCGSVFNRRRVFVSILLPGHESVQLGHREFKNFLNFINSFDQTVPFLANTSNICTVCNNTLTMNVAAGGCLIKHTKKMPERLLTLPDVISEACNKHKEFANDFLALESVSISRDDALNLAIAFLANGSLSTRAKNTAERLVQLFGCSSVGNRGQTLADLLSAFTDYYSHESSGKDADPMKQFQSSEFGDGARTKRQAMEWLIPFVGNGFKEQSEEGRKLLSEYNSRN